MDLTKYSTQIEKAIRYALQDKALELEVTLRNANVNVSVFTKFILQPSFFFFVFFRYDQ